MAVSLSFKKSFRGSGKFHAMRSIEHSCDRLSLIPGHQAEERRSLAWDLWEEPIVKMRGDTAIDECGLSNG